MSTVDALVCDVCRSTTLGSFSILPDSIHATELHQLLRSNVLPPVSVDASLQDTLRRAPAELERYDAEIQRVQHILSGIAAKRAAFVAHVDACRSVYSPVRRLPVELLAEIFEIYSATEKHLSLDPTTPKGELERLAKHHLLQLSQVSATWRKVALSTPRLWSSMVLNTTLWVISAAPMAKAISLLESALERSAVHPLRIRLTFSGGDPNSFAVMQLLSQHAERWQHIDIHAPGDSGQYLALVKGRLPLLETASFRAHLKGIDVFEVAPALRQVMFRGLHEQVPKLPWAQLRDFTYVGHKGQPSPPAPLSIAQSLGMGATFRFNADILNLNARWPSVNSNIGYLDLELGITAGDLLSKRVLGQILESLTLPHLRRFRLTPREDMALPHWNPEQFSALVVRSSFHTRLTSLHIRVIITDTELLCMLFELPCLQDLSVSERKSRPDHVSITEAFIQGITWNPESGASLVPRLRSLNLSSLLKFSDDAYWDFVISRVSPVKNVGDKPFTADLRCLRRGRRGLGPELQVRLADLVSQGVLKFTSVLR
ncbi:hypothetical protein DFH06DRAFT_1237385 [Mycena polygramma]|nr:hypothetical protein DFH06DRAFT_1237385 [Mycena polygramma]